MAKSGAVGQVASIDYEDFLAHLVGSFRHANQWMNWCPRSLPHTLVPSPNTIDMYKHVFVVNTTNRTQTSLIYSLDNWKSASGSSC